MPERKKWYQFFVSIEDEEQKLDKLEDLGKPESYSELPPQVGQFDEPPSFEQIYQAVGIKIPSHGFNIYKIEDMLKSIYLKDMNNESKKNSVLVALEAIKVPIEEIIQDAINRDKALDSYEKYEEKKLKEFETRKSDENKKIQEEIERFFNEKREQIQNNDKIVQQARERFKAWQAQKRTEETRIFEALKYFTPEHPIGAMYTSQTRSEENNSDGPITQ
jgi:hypothetical protein